MIDRATNGLSEFFYLISDSFCILLLFDTLSKQFQALQQQRLCHKEDLPFFSFIINFVGKAMVAYTKPQKWKKEESERLRGERSDQVY